MKLMYKILLSNQGKKTTVHYVEFTFLYECLLYCVEHNFPNVITFTYQIWLTTNIVLGIT